MPKDLNCSKEKNMYACSMKDCAIIISFLLFLSLTIHRTSASHVRAGEIVATRIDNSSLTFEFRFIGYRDNDTGIEFGNGDFDFGDGTVINSDFQISEVFITNNIVRAEFVVRHTYQAPATYTVSYREEFRNNDIANMASSNTTAFYVETKIVIDPLIGQNSTPILTVPPIDDGLSGVSFVHNAGAFDPDGDSLSYRLVVPRQARDVEVTNYRLPNDPFFYTSFAIGNEEMTDPPSFSIDSRNGDLFWDAPGDFFNLAGAECPDGAENCAEYNVAFLIEEWRNIRGTSVLLGSVTRDMQIIITDGDNEKPELEIPDPLCVEAGTFVEAQIIGTDPDGDSIRLEAFGGPFQINSPSTYSPNPPIFQRPPAELEFNWQTVCGHVREAPYEVQFKATDNPLDEFGNKRGPSLAEFGTWEVSVVGPAPVGLQASAGSGRAINLDWSQYFCPNATEMQIWRRVGDFAFEADECLIGIPPDAGYELVDIIGVDTLDFLDDNNGTGLAPGAKYCYRLVATFPQPAGGTSYASEEICLTLDADAPVITNVDVSATGENGEIIVAWTPPYEVNQAQFPPPYRYNVVRANDLDFTGSMELIASNIADTFFVDRGINTSLRGYSYQIALFDAGNNFVDSSAAASTVRLEVEPALNAIGLNWLADVPWSNNIQQYPFHYVYRDNVLGGDPDRLVLIDSVEVANSGFFYFDDGGFNETPLDEEIEYCYFITTLGAYDNSPLIPEPLLNRSQVLCAQPRDIIPPCTPLALSAGNEFDCEQAIADQSCAFTDFQNEIFWERDLDEQCDDDIMTFNVYFSPTGLEDDYEVIASVVDQFFVHEGIPSFKGCYRISAVDRSGNESELTEEICFDNCPNYALPNVFTPNADGKNDIFTPIFSSPVNPIAGFDNSNCPRFVDSVIFTVFDRTGKSVFEYDSNEAESGILINWDGKTDQGRDLPAGVYFYSAEVKFDVLASRNDTEKLSGWVQILK